MTLEAPCHSIDLIHDSAKIQHIQEDDVHRTAKLSNIIQFINTDINDLLKNYSPHEQEEIDEKLKWDNLTRSFKVAFLAIRV